MTDQSVREILFPLAKKYIWWSRSEEAMMQPHRIIAQVMDIGDFEDAQEMMRALGEDILKDTIQHAEAGWFRPRSWHYWHYRLHLAKTGQVPPLPKRELK